MENETAKQITVSGQGTIEIKVVIDGKTITKPMNLNNTDKLTIE